MDILKILSRGVKQPPSSTKNANRSTVKLPSAGIQANPQLYNDDVGSSRGHKRKRNGDEDPKPTVPELPEVDFFSPKEEREPQPESPTQWASADNDQSSVGVVTTPPQLLSAVEIRDLLRSHRLKFTLLSDRVLQSRVTKAKKKKKDKAASTPGLDKKDKKQLFPQPLNSFGELQSLHHVSSKLLGNLTKEGYKLPTEVQMGSLPLLLDAQQALQVSGELDDIGDTEAGVDFLAVAPTGSGKTINFLIPAIDTILKRQKGSRDLGDHELQVVVVAPTRELAFQIVNEGRKLALGTDIKIVGMRKGMRLTAGLDDDEDGLLDESSTSEHEEGSESEADEKDTSRARPVTKAEILVTTPLHLLNFVKGESDTPSKTLPTVTLLVLDEADVLLDPIFREQTMGIWSACTNSSLRVTCWSATMGSNIETLVKEKLASRAEEMGLAPSPFVRLVVGLKDTAVPNITHKLIYTATEPGKLLALRQLLHPTTADDSGPPLRPPFLVFTQTIDRATALHDELKYDIPLAAGGSSRIASLHSGLSDSARAAIMRRFRAGEIWVLITTDVLARGVDFAGVNGVVNYDVPGSSAAYVHRAGRTGRAGREGGLSVTFYTKEDIPFVKTVANVIAVSEKQAGKTEDEAGVQKWLLDTLPNVAKADKKRLKQRGVEARRSGSASKITTTSGWERRRDNNRKGAMMANKKRRKTTRGGNQGDAGAGGEDSEWGGIDD
jgi:ATP-dependent RNA helicase DDX52/ROK1